MVITRQTWFAKQRANLFTELRRIDDLEHGEKLLLLMLTFHNRPPFPYNVVAMATEMLFRQLLVERFIRATGMTLDQNAGF